jgi:hypothetical protein
MEQRTIDALRKKGYLPPATDEEKKVESSKQESPDVIEARAAYMAKMTAAIA